MTVRVGGLAKVEVRFRKSAEGEEEGRRRLSAEGTTALVPPGVIRRGRA